MRGDIEKKPVKYSYSFPNIGAAMHMRQYAMQTKLAAQIIFKLYFVGFLSCFARQYYGAGCFGVPIVFKHYKIKVQYLFSVHRLLKRK